MLIVVPACSLGGVLECFGLLGAECFGLLELTEALFSFFLGDLGSSYCLLKESDCLLVCESFCLFLCLFCS